MLDHVPVPVPHNFSEQEVLALLEKQGYTRVFARTVARVEAPAKPDARSVARRRPAVSGRQSCWR